MKNLKTDNQITEILNIPPFSLSKKEKKKLFGNIIQELTIHHYENCNEYKRILDFLEINPSSLNLSTIPPIPVRLFKAYNLISIEKSKIIKTLTSSGTTGQSVSQIFLDKKTSINQTKVLSKIVSSFIGLKRLPMLIIDSKAVIKDRNLFSARGAGILGFSLFGNDVTYALDENMKLDLDILEDFCKKYNNQDVLVFGFTFMIWKYFYKELKKRKKTIPLEKGILIHGGGWKKMIDEEVDNNNFKNSLRNLCGINRIHNYYGMVEQTGSIFMECKEGYLHTSIFSDINILRNDFSFCNNKEKGLVQISSVIPNSYPGHILLSEDEGEIFGEDDCPCGRLGKYFKIYGRVMDAEIRGCSDTHESSG